VSDLFQPISRGQLFRWVFNELESSDSLFGIARKNFFVPKRQGLLRTRLFGRDCDTPFGPAAGPHSQMAQNIVVSWLCGARYIELKTVQTLDELDVSKPCIDMEDEGYNVEWSQELKVHQSYEEYLRAWVVIHALHHKLGFPGRAPAMVFNLSVGYDLQGIRQDNMQWFLDRVRDSSAEKAEMIEQLAEYYPPVLDIGIPDCISDNITLSTMHGCPPGEIGSICEYLIKERGFHTFVKCNPTLLGAGKVRAILNNQLGYRDVVVPDSAFAHDLAFDDAVPLLRDLRAVAADHALEFGVKLSNTLEVENFRTVFDGKEKMMYLSGRALHAITVRLAQQLAHTFEGDLPMSFSAGADCFNAADLLAAGMKSITVCSDLLKTGGYLRLLQYIENSEEAIRKTGASGIRGLITNSAGAADPATAALANLDQYAGIVCEQDRFKKDTFLTSHSKTRRPLNLFDCIAAPCTDRCAVDQKVPQYMRAVREGDYPRAAALAREDNPIPTLLARTCDHLCEPACVRTHLDEPLAIRHIKRFIMEHEAGPLQSQAESVALKVAIIGAGPGGLSAALKLAQAGATVEVFEQHGYAGGMVGGAIPEYRLPSGVIDRDLAVLDQLGVRIHYNRSAGRDFSLKDLRQQGFERIVVTVGAQLGKKLGLDNEDCEGVIDALDFLRASREGRPVPVGPRIGIIGAGDTAMDCARTAWRRAGDGVSIIYRRSLDQMPADREEIRCLLDEGTAVTGMAKPFELLVEAGRLRGLKCRRMEFRGDRDASGRKIPHEVPGEEFEVPLDSLILAISQNALLDFFGDEHIELNEWGYIKADPVTFRTSLDGVYAGGDVVNDGPSSIVEAAADGKAIAGAILGQVAGAPANTAKTLVDTAALNLRKSRRQWRMPVPHTEPSERRNFNEVVLDYTEQQARVEAGRCLDCHQYCSLCVGVCPNMALQTLQIEPFEVELATYKAGGVQKAGDSVPFRVAQPYQVAVLTDFCNECGNCTTFCPTAGEPWRDKPRLYLDRSEFDAQSGNAFMVTRKQGRWSIESRTAGGNHILSWGTYLDYRGPSLSARIDPTGLHVQEVEAQITGEDTGTATLEHCFEMVALLAGIRNSMPHLPTAEPEGAAE
jgi:putative selenate reductase